MQLPAKMQIMHCVRNAWVFLIAGMALCMGPRWGERRLQCTAICIYTAVLGLLSCTLHASHAWCSHTFEGSPHLFQNCSLEVALADGRRLDLLKTLRKDNTVGAVVCSPGAALPFPELCVRPLCVCPVCVRSMGVMTLAVCCMCLAGSPRQHTFLVHACCDSAGL